MSYASLIESALSEAGDRITVAGARVPREGLKKTIDALRKGPVEGKRLANYTLVQLEKTDLVDVVEKRLGGKKGVSKWAITPKGRKVLFGSKFSEATEKLDERASPAGRKGDALVRAVPKDNADLVTRAEELRDHLYKGERGKARRLAAPLAADLKKAGAGKAAQIASKIARLIADMTGALDESILATVDELLVESLAWQRGLSSFSPIAPGDGGASTTYGGPGDAGGGGDTPGMSSNAQTAAQATAVAEAGRVFAGLYQGAFPGKRLSVRGQTYEVTTNVTRGANRDWLSMCNRKGEQFLLMLPAKGPDGQLNAGHLSLMQTGRANTAPIDISVADLVKENEEFFEDALEEGEPFGFDRLDAVTEGMKAGLKKDEADLKKVEAAIKKLERGQSVPNMTLAGAKATRDGLKAAIANKKRSLGEK